MDQTILEVSSYINDSVILLFYDPELMLCFSAMVRVERNADHHRVCGNAMLGNPMMGHQGRAVAVAEMCLPLGCQTEPAAARPVSHQQQMFSSHSQANDWQMLLPEETRIFSASLSNKGSDGAPGQQRLPLAQTQRSANSLFHLTPSALGGFKATRAGNFVQCLAALPFHGMGKGRVCSAPGFALFLTASPAAHEVRCYFEVPLLPLRPQGLLAEQQNRKRQIIAASR